MSGRPKTVKRAISVRKKGLSTPDPSATPTASESSMSREREGGGEASIDEVLRGGEIEALRVTEEKLRKLHPPKPPSSEKKPVRSRKVVVRRSQAVTGTHPPTARHRGVAVLRPLPPGTVVLATKTLGCPPPGARFEEGGTLVQHSILGPIEDYASELKGTGMDNSTSKLFRPPPVVLPPVEATPPEDEMSYEKTIVPREAHALEYWTQSMAERNALQEDLATKLHSSPERLLMNQGDSYRAVQEERALIDRAIPAVDYGKGYRVGSEFWSQQVRIGDSITGIDTTLTRTERGLPPEMEFVGVPSVVRGEKGVHTGSERNAPLHYTCSWTQSHYLSTRQQQLDAHPFRPEVSRLQVLGHTPGHTPRMPPRSNSLDSLGDGSSSGLSSEEEGSIMYLPDVTSQPIVGPALALAGHLLEWEEPGRRGEGVCERVVLESGVGQMATSHLPMENTGTTAIYFSWQRLSNPNPLGTIQSGDTQRFYFDTRGGVLLPGQKLSFPFVFKSPNAGIFSEDWRLLTGPVLCGGREVRVRLRGVATQEDTNADRRAEVEQMLTHRMAEAAARKVVDTIVDSIRTPPHTPEPFEATELEEDVFRSRNPELYYHHNVVQHLKSIYDELLRPELVQDEVTTEPSTTKAGKKDKEEKSKKAAKGEGKKGKPPPVLEEVAQEPSTEEVPKVEVPDWDLSVAGLLQVIMGVEEEEVREGKLQQLSTLVGQLSFPPPPTSKRGRYRMGYQILCEAIDSVASTSIHLCQLLGLPLRECTPAIRQPIGEEDQSPSTPSSPAQGKKDKKSGKDNRKGDVKQKGAKEKEGRAASVKGKAVAGKKSKAAMAPKELEGPEVTSEREVRLRTEVNPEVEKQYLEKLYNAVHEILGCAADRMAALFEDNA